MTDHDGPPDHGRPEASPNLDPAISQYQNWPAAQPTATPAADRPAVPAPPASRVTRPVVIALSVVVALALVSTLAWWWLKSQNRPADDPTGSVPTAVLPPTPLPGQNTATPPLAPSSWARTYGGAGEDRFYAVAVAADGGVLAAGDTDSADGDITDNQGGRDALLTKLAPDGRLLWTQVYGGEGWDSFEALAVTADGDIVVAGYLADGDTTSALVAKLAPDGVFSWIQAYGSAGRSSFEAVAVAADGSVWVAGDTNSADGYTTVDPDHHYGLLAKFAPDGAFLWSQTHSGDGGDSFTALAMAADGDIYAAGATRSADGDGTADPGQSDALLLKVAPDGSLRWAQAYGGSGDDAFTALAMAADGDILAAGSTDSADGDIAINHGGGDALLAKIAPDGTLRWAQSYGSTDNDWFAAVAVTDNGRIFTAGYTGQADGRSLPNALVAEITPDGTAVWAQNHGGTGWDSFHALAIAADGGLLAAGSTNSTDGDLPPSDGQFDLLAVKLTPDGELG
ncbi:MAG: hypothetical protein LBK42_03145 [Propionibacteriaceae bacterium]|jgi:uncharacterized delta-60 repeat protein|nr:hypothetical protein [Propionibacteriaceae bacterium]